MVQGKPARPFLKWAGGKTQLLHPIGKLLPPRIEGTYFEPFLGSGAVFFHLRAEGRLHGGAVLSDANGPLVETWRAVRDRVERVIEHLARHRIVHARNPRDHYYKVRAGKPRDPAARAARFIYLNKTCYNGLYRVNRSGQFNVPMGRYRDPPILDEENLRAAAAALQGTKLLHGPYWKTLRQAGRGAVVYMDPPYLPHSETANFTSYTALGFAPVDQVRLAVTCLELSEKEGVFLLSNHAAPKLRALYELLGFRVASISAPRSISCVSSSRKDVVEFLVTPR